MNRFGAREIIIVHRSGNKMIFLQKKIEIALFCAFKMHLYKPPHPQVLLRRKRKSSGVFLTSIFITFSLARRLLSFCRTHRSNSTVSSATKKVFFFASVFLNIWEEDGGGVKIGGEAREGGVATAAKARRRDRRFFVIFLQPNCTCSKGKGEEN